MKRIRIIIFILTGILFISCNRDSNRAPKDFEETPTSGETTILVDNTIQPIVEDVLAVFHSVYDNANIIQVNRNELEIVNALLKDSSRVAVLPRLLTREEEAHFK